MPAARDGAAAGRPPSPPRGAHRPSRDFESIQPGVFGASTVIFPDMASFRARDWTSRDRFIYGSHGTPTTFALEDRIARLEHGEHCVLCPSGLNAIALVYIAFLKPGDELLVPVDVYAANRRFVVGELASWGVGIRPYDASRLETLEFTPATRLVWIDAPCTLTFEFPDVPAIAALARRHGVPTAVDNTWGAGVAFTPLDFGIDLSVQSLGKYAAGSGDVMMGAVACRDKPLYDTLKRCAMRIGSCVSSGDAASVMKGLDTLELRYGAQAAAAGLLIDALAGSQAGFRIFHPSRSDCRGHEVWRRDARGAAGLFSLLFDARHDEAAVDRFIDALRLFRIGFGWGGPRSLVLSHGRSAGTRAPDGELVRFSVGLEPPEALLDDLLQGLRALRSS